MSGFEPGKMPSKMELFKLVMDSDFREAAETVCAFTPGIPVGFTID